ncbi:hypothetical protein N7532_004561 [Penicillium argentinense]|uniref:NADP-dependent oxidoreductase domain-containing protein n=1 Tax=Penicillium argentinense TaxID=1131581 RepID=A0A9W9FQ36_9EURO|nr:uncharacterized protein N7532_004561 [Penicillium argentinense]KAJ5104032.1 hypothetical protein N7532_004561 [Penicillium argentinense]
METKIDKSAHVSMMADSIIANLLADGLRAVMRGLLANRSDCTAAFEEQTRVFIHETVSGFSNATAKRTNDLSGLSIPSVKETCQRVCCMICCGQVPNATEDDHDMSRQLAFVDGTIIQTLTAVQKTLSVPSGVRELSPDERLPLDTLLKSLQPCKLSWEGSGGIFPFERGLEATINLVDPTSSHEISEELSISKNMEQFWKYIQNGFTAFDTADHYGDAEIIFGRCRKSSPISDTMFAATKFCVFHPMSVTPEAIGANVSERCHRLQTEKIDLLQFHWQYTQYDDTQYIDALKYLSQDDRIKHLGLCNFDTENMRRVVESGVKDSHQVQVKHLILHLSRMCSQSQVSLIDSRPTVRIIEFCEKHDIKLLTYGTLTFPPWTTYLDPNAL